MKETLSPAERIDPANIRRWWCTRGGFLTVVLATNRDEARAIADFWFAKRRPFGWGSTRVREATDADVERWLTVWGQQEAFDMRMADEMAAARELSP